MMSTAETTGSPAEERPWREIEVDWSNTELWEAFEEAHTLPAGGDRLEAQKRFSELAAEQYPDYDSFQVYTAYFNASEFKY